MILPYIPSLSESLSLPSLVVDGRISVSFFIVTLPPCQKLEILIAHILNFCTALETITQQIVIDGVVVAAIVYHLQRSMNTGIPPSAELIGVQRYKPTSTTRRTHARTQSQPYIAPSQHFDLVEAAWPDLHLRPSADRLITHTGRDRGIRDQRLTDLTLIE